MDLEFETPEGRGTGPMGDPAHDFVRRNPSRITVPAVVLQAAWPRPVEGRPFLGMALELPVAVVDQLDSAVPVALRRVVGDDRTVPSRPLAPDRAAAVKLQTRLDVEAIDITKGRTELPAAVAKLVQIVPPARLDIIDDVLVSVGRRDLAATLDWPPVSLGGLRSVHAVTRGSGAADPGGAVRGGPARAPEPLRVRERPDGSRYGGPGAGSAPAPGEVTAEDGVAMGEAGRPWRVQPRPPTAAAVP